MSISIAFKRLHYPVDVIFQCLRWYLTYSVSLRELEEMMVERGIHVGSLKMQSVKMLS